MCKCGKDSESGEGGVGIARALTVRTRRWRPQAVSSAAMATSARRSDQRRLCECAWTRVDVTVSVQVRMRVR